MSNLVVLRKQQPPQSAAAAIAFEHKKSAPFEKANETPTDHNTYKGMISKRSGVNREGDNGAVGLENLAGGSALQLIAAMTVSNNFASSIFGNKARMGPHTPRPQQTE